MKMIRKLNLNKEEMKIVIKLSKKWANRKDWAERMRILLHKMNGENPLSAK